MEQCPTCLASYRGGEQCYRCKADLAPLLAIEQAARRRYAQAVVRFRQGHYRESLALVEAALLLKRWPEGELLRQMNLAGLGEITPLAQTFLKIHGSSQSACPPNPTTNTSPEPSGIRPILP